MNHRQIPRQAIDTYAQEAAKCQPQRKNRHCQYRIHRVRCPPLPDLCGFTSIIRCLQGRARVLKGLSGRTMGSVEAVQKRRVKRARAHTSWEKRKRLRRREKVSSLCDLTSRVPRSILTERKRFSPTAHGARLWLMRVLGIDCGTEYTGFGVVELGHGGKLICLARGAVKLSARMSMPVRLSTIFDRLGAIIVEFRPDRVAIEDVFYALNVKSALKLGQVPRRGYAGRIVGGA